jgi:hypothetical protein
VSLIAQTGDLSWLPAGTPYYVVIIVLACLSLWPFIRDRLYPDLRSDRQRKLAAEEQIAQVLTELKITQQDMRIELKAAIQDMRTEQAQRESRETGQVQSVVALIQALDTQIRSGNNGFALLNGGQDALRSQLATMMAMMDPRFDRRASKRTEGERGE